MRSKNPILRHGAPTLAALVTAMALGGCGAVVLVAPQGDAGGGDVTRADTPAPQDVATPRDAVAPRTCLRQSDCPSGLECVGPPGCAVAWTCVALQGRPCTDDLAPYCGCDGVTIAGSSTCPPGPYRARGACEAPVSCLLPNGGRCAAGQTCAVDRCTSCACDTNGELRCRSTCPPDAGVARLCRSNSDCVGGSLCQGPEGCGVTWTCSATPVDCDADLAYFCGCDGRTFQASSSCPGQLYRHRGRCESADAGAPACAPVDARAEGACDLFLGYVWNGRQCAPLSGCRCVGPGCDQLVPDREACLFAHTLCPR